MGKKPEYGSVPVVNDFAPRINDDVVGAVCRKKGFVTVEFCAMCPEFQPACRVSEGDQMEGNDGIDPRTGNSYATCKWFGKLLRRDGGGPWGSRKVA